MQSHFTTIKLNKIPDSFAERNSYFHLNNAAEQRWSGVVLAVWRVAAAGGSEGPGWGGNIF